MAWQPQEEPLRQLAQYLRESLSAHDKNAQKQAELMLAQAKSSPDINNYLIYLFSNSSPPQGLDFTIQQYHAVRAAAAVMLKNNIRQSYKSIPEPSLELIRSSITHVLRDKNPQIRGYAGNVITELISTGGILGWPQVLHELLALVSNEGESVPAEAQEGAMAALAKICEDNKKLLNKDYHGQRPLNIMIPKLIEFLESPHQNVRQLALTSLNVFIPIKPQAVLVNLDVLLSRLFQLANDPSSTVRRQLCRAFVHVAEARSDKIQPHIAGLVDFFIAQQRKVEDEDLALDAAEFWLSLAEHDNLWRPLGPHLDKIIPVLVDSMVYTEEDVIALGTAEDDADSEDKLEDIKPKFAKSKGLRNLTGTGQEQQAVENGGEYTKIPGRSDDDLDEGEIKDESEDEDDGGDTETQWNLRKCSAAALDMLATNFHGPVFDRLLPYLMIHLKHENWLLREASVLALGAVAEGCMEFIAPHLPELVPYLLSLLNDSQPPVRQITCWTLSRFVPWTVGIQDPAERSRYFEPMMEGLLTKMLDRSKRVQEAGASAFASLEEKAEIQLLPYSEPIIRQFVRCFDTYKDKNMFILYDCVQTLAEQLGSSLAAPELLELLMPALIQRWQKVSDQSRELIALLECLAYLVAAIGQAFDPFAQPIFTRCVKIIRTNLEDYVLYLQNQALDIPDKDFLITSLDLISAIIQALDGTRSAQLVSSAQPGFFELIAFCMEDVSHEVRQSGYALLGDCAKFVSPQLRPFLPNLMPVVIKQLDLNDILDEQASDWFSVVNNACWSTGEIAVQNGKEISPYIEQLLQRFLDILENPDIPPSVTENAAIALGRLGLANAEMLAPHLTVFAAPFLETMSGVEYTDEKMSAFTGFTMIVGQNPQAMEKDLLRFFGAIAQYRYDNQDGQESGALQSLFAQALSAYKSLIPDFDSFLAQLPPADREALRATYNL